ncbi:ABC transporter ATP-binding protein [Thiohalocapsa marina]|uniref:ABC transporter ATP-binding protein n=1 Tax=Thiohalocapsa marina TaxID=424902 RepID=UPI0036DCCF83
MSLLEASALQVRLGGKPLVRDLSFALDAGELLGLIGPNGAGKSTALKALVQLLPHSGAIRLDGRDPATLPARERGRRIAYLSQNDSLQWPISVRDLVALGRHPYRGSWWRSDGGLGRRDDEAIDKALRATDVWHLRGRKVTELSGGERARARLARVLAVEAPVILADEPVAALDPRHQLRVMELLRAQSRQGRGLILVLHDLTLASRFCDRLLLLDRGRPVASGTPDTVLTQPHLRAVYGIRAVSGRHQGQDYLLPWECV